MTKEQYRKLTKGYHQEADKQAAKRRARRRLKQADREAAKRGKR